MKLIAKLCTAVLLFYLAFWASVAVYFSYAERQTALLEHNLTKVFGNPVSIDKITTAWKGWSPVIQVEGLSVAGSNPEQPALSFRTLSAEISALSILRLWPSLNELALEQPSLEIVSLPSNQLQIAGIKLGTNRSSKLNPKRLISWLLNHQSAAWHDGEIVWQRLDGERRVYSDISFVYQRQASLRSIAATGQTTKGAVAFKAEANGEVLEADNWDASLEVLGNQGRRLVAPDDLSLKVVDGQGRLRLKALDFQRIQDFVLIAGLGESASWLLDSHLAGRLHDVSFEFSGPLFEFEDWTLQGFASEVSFKQTNRSPAMNNLAGNIHVNSDGGSFEFSAEQAIFDWPKWFDHSFEIDRASGQFDWSMLADGSVQIQLKDGSFADTNALIWNLNASCNVDNQSRNVSNLAQLFKVDSVADLDYESGKLVNRGNATGSQLTPMYLDASAEFEVESLSNLIDYFPNDPRLAKLIKWWNNAFLSGTTSAGKLSYQGELSRNALKVGKAQLRGQTHFADVDIDYGYERSWPKLLQAQGVATLENSLLTITPQQAWLEKDLLENAKVNISSLFYLDRELKITGGMETSVPILMDFLFDGPLLKPQQRGRPLPIIGQSGRARADVEITIPLRRVRDARVVGTARVWDANLLLPQGVPVLNASADVSFTERSVQSQNIQGTFLDGPVTATLVTTEIAQPPVMKLSGTGNGQIKQLQPWLGEHILSLLEGQAEWQGSVLIDGPSVQIDATSDLVGVAVQAPIPLAKVAATPSNLTFNMQVGSNAVQQTLDIEFGKHLRASMQGDLSRENNLLDNSLILLAEEQASTPMQVQPGINFSITQQQVDLDQWLDAIIDLAQLQTSQQATDESFLDAMRSINIASLDPVFLGRQFGKLDLRAISVDGNYWVGSVSGDNVKGSLMADPRADVARYGFNLSKLHLPKPIETLLEPAPIDHSLQPADYPRFELLADDFKLSGKPLGQLEIAGEPVGDAWQLSKFELSDKGIRTAGSGRWVNNAEFGSLTSLEAATVIDEAGDVLDEMDFNGVIKKGEGTIKAGLNWLGSPHEFEFARLNGEFEINIEDGELVKIVPGSGRLLGLLNLNAIARRLTLDFSDVFSAGLQFDLMHYSGLLADGEAIMQDAYVLTPSVLITMEGKLDLNTELIDMELHAYPELAGNLTLLSAIANPAAGAIMFLAQQIFKDQMRTSSFKSYRALGGWEDFELVEFDSGKSPSATAIQADQNGEPKPGEELRKTVAPRDSSQPASEASNTGVDSSNSDTNKPSLSESLDEDSEAAR